MKRFFSRVPTEVFKYNIISFCDPKEIGRLKQISNDLHLLLEDASVWKYLVRQHFKKKLIDKHSNKDYYKTVQQIKNMFKQKVPCMYGAGLFSYFQQHEKKMVDLIKTSNLHYEIQADIYTQYIAPLSIDFGGH